MRKNQMKYQFILEKKWKKKQKREKQSWKHRMLFFQIWKITLDCFRICMATLVFAFAFVGMTALFYKSPREELLVIWERFYNEIIKNIPKIPCL